MLFLPSAKTILWNTHDEVIYTKPQLLWLPLTKLVRP